MRCKAEGRQVRQFSGFERSLSLLYGKTGGLYVGVTDKGGIDEFTDLVWNSLNEENKVSLFVRFIDIETGKYETRIVNKNK